MFVFVYQGDEREKKEKKLLLMQNFPSLESDEDLFREMSTTNFWVLNLCGLSQEVNGERNDAEIKFLAVQTIYHAESCERRRKWKSLPRQAESAADFPLPHTPPIQRKTLRQYFPRFDSQNKQKQTALFAVHLVTLCTSKCTQEISPKTNVNFPAEEKWETKPQTILISNAVWRVQEASRRCRDGGMSQ